ncbi:uncharacterized protein BP5553_01901 [Venustampulla echinocandica]|uniref:Glutaredoxin domain-containing protein n=1 Tax=Venustampulla echinocandica TaxID=2656787 RepID=A0A370U2C0_9HELO|nr:uncharacterized protein BP5553_01901 [Venustampulla echinocandica]RDL41922.1 hypothetical protein BP5553_01901 [Venustampulla echinocandica]
MPSARRVKVFGLLIFIFVITVLFYTSSLRQQRSQDPRTLGDFYAKTVHGLDKNKNHGTGKTAGTGASGDKEVAAAMAARLKDAAKVAKDNANAKAPKPDAPSEVVGVGNAAGDGRSVAGRKKFPPGSAEAQEPVREETLEEHEVEEVLNTILKKSPIIIFSKSYCPFSRKAKTILLEQYSIDPAPYVVELDQHKLGPQLQAKLAELTGRKTVPNVLINGVSIGGGDDIAELDENKKLISKIKDLGAKKVINIKARPDGYDSSKSL